MFSLSFCQVWFIFRPFQFVFSVFFWSICINSLLPCPLPFLVVFLANVRLTTFGVMHAFAVDFSSIRSSWCGRHIIILKIICGIWKLYSRRCCYTLLAHYRFFGIGSIAINSICFPRVIHVPFVKATLSFALNGLKTPTSRDWSLWDVSGGKDKWTIPWSRE